MTMPSNRDDQDEDIQYRVVVNHEEQYSIWPVDRELPLGWSEAGKTGTKAECLAHIDTVWTDMRPLSLRRAMAGAAARGSVSEEPAGDEAPREDAGDDLVTRLSRGEHPLRALVRPEGQPEALREAIARGYVLIELTGTAGGTQLGLRLRPDDSREIRDDRVRLTGHLTLDGVPVRCVAELELRTLTGHGHLERLDPGGEP